MGQVTDSSIDTDAATGRTNPVPALLHTDYRRGMAPNRALLNRRAAASLCVLFLAGCQSAMSPSLSTSGAAVQRGAGGHSVTTDDWPLRFREHKFDAYCFSTVGCEVVYGGMLRIKDLDDRLKIASAALKNYPAMLTAGMGPIANFPPPAKVSWLSRDGSSHRAEVDIGEIFKDQLVHHNMRREELLRNQGVPPEIILEVNDRTINVYMRATLWTKAPQRPGHPHSNYRDDLIKAYSRTY